MCCTRPTCHYVCEVHMGITYNLNINSVHVLAVDVRELMFRWSPYSNMSAVNCADYVWKTGHCFKLPFNLGLFFHCVGKPYVSTAHMYDAIQNAGHYKGTEGWL